MNNLKDEALAVVDVETSGVNPFRNDVLAIGIVPLFAERQPLEIYVRPAGSIIWDEFAARNFQNYKSKWEAAAVNSSDACDAIEQYFADCFPGTAATLIGHNIGFDISFLKRLAFNGDRDELANVSHRAIDTHTILYLLYLQNKIPRFSLSSDGAFSYFGIDPPEKSRHTAIGDALATRDLVLRLFTDFCDDVSLTLSDAGTATVRRRAM